jgi:uncharacterized protein (DUF2062 family)/trans-aconitate methyltransferase
MTPRRAAGSVAVGLFVGVQPLFGLHLALCTLLCWPLRLDIVLAYVAAHVSNPILAPFIVLAELEVGSWIVDGRWLGLDWHGVGPRDVIAVGWRGMVGSLTLGGILAFVGAAGTFVCARRLTRAPAPDRVEQAIRRTVRRFASAPLPDRVYVGMKLRRDPLLRRLVALATPFGRVVDVGCGRGQLGLALMELGLARSVVGFDFDERKVELARHASRGDGLFATGDVTIAQIAAAETVLLIDLLNYLSRTDQEALLERAVSAVERPGRLLIRVLDARRARWFWLTRLAEAATTAIGYNRARTLHYWPVSEIVRMLASHGLRVERFETSEGTPFCHVLLLASHA